MATSIVPPTPEAVRCSPAHFAEDHPEALHQAIREIGLATLITVGPDGIEANPIPMVIAPSPPPTAMWRAPEDHTGV